MEVEAEGGEEFQHATDRGVGGAVAHEWGGLRLLDAEDFGEFDLGQAARL